MGSLYHLNVGCADASIIETGSATFLVDCHDVENHSSLLPASKHLRGVFITHQHPDHFSGLEYLREHGYTIDYLIYSPYDRRYGDNSVSLDEWKEFESHKLFFKNAGTKLFSPYRQDSFEEPYWNTNGVTFEIIGPNYSIATSDTRELHDACLIIKAILGERNCLFTGDASDENLEYIARNTENFCNDILHASHHGSINGAELSFIKKCNAEYTVISTETGVHENVPHPTALRRYSEHTKEKVYRTDKDGTLTWGF